MCLPAGIEVKPGSGIGKAIEYWQQTAKVIPTRWCRRGAGKNPALSKPDGGIRCT
jgi:hypothetical protein